MYHITDDASRVYASKVCMLVISASKNNHSFLSLLTIVPIFVSQHQKYLHHDLDILQYLILHTCITF